MSVGALVADLDGPLGLFDQETGAVWVQKGLPPQVARCTVMHEAIHRIGGHGAPVSNWEKNRRELATHRVMSMVALSFHTLLEAMVVSQSLREAAARCGVDFDTFTTRLMGLSPLEQTMLEVCGRYCLGFPWAAETVKVVPL
jgi:hypothetical protein